MMVPPFCFEDRVNKVVEDLPLLTATHHFSVLPLGLSAAICILYVVLVVYSSLYHITHTSVRNAALMPFGSSGSRSLTKSRDNVGDRTSLFSRKR